MEVKKPAEEFSKEDLRRQLYSSLRSTGVLDSMKGQLRARLLEHLRHHNGESIEMKRKQRQPSLKERLLNSLFLDYLECNGFTFTISVFMPESQMTSWRPFAYEEMLELLHLDPSSDLHVHLKISGEERECLAHQLVTVLQRMAQRNRITEVSTQTSPAAAVCKPATRTSCTSPKDLERSMKEVEDAYIRKQEAQRALPYRSLEDKITILHQEFDARVNAEVALQINRLRDYEINAARMDEAARYRRQLARDREELEDIHKSRMNRIKAREESLLERMLSKEKAIEASAYEQRQKILTEITSLRERENKLRQFKESQERREEKLDARELSIRANEEEVVSVRKSLYAQADEIAALRRKELEEQYKELCEHLQHDRSLLEAEREQIKEEKVAMAIELAASRSDKELINALHHRLRVEEDQRFNLVKTTRELEAALEEKLKQQKSLAPTPVNVSEQRLEQQLREIQSELEQERLQRQASDKESKTLERKLQQKKVELAAARAPQGEWITEHKNLVSTIHQQDVELQKKETKLQLMEVEIEEMTTRHKKLLLKIDHLDKLVKEAQEERNRATHELEILQDQHNTTEGELLETVTLLRKAKKALETERLDHCALQPHQKTLVSSISADPPRAYTSQDKHEQINSLFEPRPSADEIIRKKWESFRKKPRRESHDLWTHVLSDTAARKLSQNHDLARIPIDHFPTSTISKPLSSDFGYQLLEMHNDGSIMELDGKSNWQTNGDDKACDLNSWKAMTREEFGTNTMKDGITCVTKTEALIEAMVTNSMEDIYTSSWDGEGNNEDEIPSWKRTPLSIETRTSNWNNDHEELKNKSIVTSHQDEFVSSVFSITRDAENLWNLGHSGDDIHRDGIHSQGLVLFEGEEKMSKDYNCQDLLSSLQSLEITAENHRRQIHSPSATDIQGTENSPEETKPLEAHRMESFEGVQTTVTAQRDTAISTSEIKCKGGVPNLCTTDISELDNQLSVGRPETDVGLNPLREIESGHLDLENLQVSESMGEDEGCDSGRSSFPIARHRVMMEATEEASDIHGREVSKEQDYATSSDGKEEIQTNVHEFSMTTNIQTSVGNTDFKEDSESPLEPEENNANGQLNEISSEEKTSLEPTANQKESLTVHDIDSDKGDNADVQEGADNSWSLYLGEEDADTRENSEAEESSSEDTTPSCKCLASLKRDLELLEETSQSADELLMNSSCGPRMDSQSEGEQHETASEEVNKLEMKAESDVIRLSVQSVDSKPLKCEEDNQHARSSEIISTAVEEGETKQEIHEDQTKEIDADLLVPTDVVPCEAYEPVNLTNEVNQVAMDLTSLVPISIQSEETDSRRSTTLSISNSDSEQDPDKDFNKLMRCLGLSKDGQQGGSNKKEDEPLSQRVLSLNSQNKESVSLMHENVVPASGKMSGLPEIGELLYKQEKQAREQDHRNLSGYLLQDSAQDPPEKVEVIGNKNANLDHPQASKPSGHDKHALETLRSSIVMRKHDLSETAKESPRLVDNMGTPKNHPTLALAIRNNRLVKLEKQDELEKNLRSSFLNQRHVEATMNTSSTQNEKQSSKETSRSVDNSSNIQPSETTRTPRPCGETNSSSEESIYQGDSFEEDEEEEDDEDNDQGLAYSEESCTNAATRKSSDEAISLETNGRSSSRSKPNVESNESRSAERSSANWEGESEHGSYSPDEKDTIALPV